MRTKLNILQKTNVTDTVGDLQQGDFFLVLDTKRNREALDNICPHEIYVYLGAGQAAYLGTNGPIALSSVPCVWEKISDFIDVKIIREIDITY